MSKKIVGVVSIVLAFFVCIEHMNIYAGDDGTGIRWSGERVIFGPLHTDHPIPAGEVLGSFPDVMELEGSDRLPQLSLTPNRLPDSFEKRQLFSPEVQATVSAGWDIDLSLPDVELSDGKILGLQSMPERQIFLHKRRGETRDTVNRHFNEPVKMRLSKYRYPFEDRHLDAIVWTSPPEQGQEPGGRLKIMLKDADGDTLAEHAVDELSRSGLFFSVGFPPQLEGRKAALEVIWSDGDREMGRASATFHVRQAAGVGTSGRVPITVLNEPGAYMKSAPMTTGVPFPRGALADESNVRLVDEHGEEVALQTKITARWSRFGPIKWLLCDFTADFDGRPRNFFLEYGPDIERRPREPMAVTGGDAGFPALDAGRIRVTDEAIEFDARGDGTFKDVLDAGALRGAFVGHENGKVFTIPEEADHAVEELGSEKAVVRRSGWYRHADSGEEFCNYVTRFVFHRNSPVVRVFHTWIFTGDGNRDRIADMGWRFDASGHFEPDGLLSSFEDGVWHKSHHLVQFDYQAYDLLGGIDRGRRDGRAPGVMGGSVGGTRVLFGAKDFWQNFPSELEVSESGLTFYNWPSNNPRATLKRPVARQDAFRNRFVHEGELLDFRIPEEYAEGDIWEQATGSGRVSHWEEREPETANAQGIARTEEMFLYFLGDEGSVQDAALVMQGLNDETLRAVVDPEWMTNSGVFGKVHPRDAERFKEKERIYELGSEAPARWVERLDFYGMWLHGDYPTWNLNLPGRWVSAYRTLNKNHRGPYSWIPFIRSADTRFLKLAEAGTRQMTDANFCHYASSDVDAAISAPETADPTIYFRRQGFLNTSLLPWVGGAGGYSAPYVRHMSVDTDYMWYNYYLTGYARARDVALLFAELTQNDHRSVGGGRVTQGMLQSYIDLYKATFDPWFLNAIHVLADLHAHLYAADEIDPLMYDHPRDIVGFDNWRSADQTYYNFTGCDAYEQVARNAAMGYANPNMVACRAGTGTAGGGGGRHSFHAWERTEDDLYLGRLAATLDTMYITSYDGEIEWMRSGPRSDGIPMALSVLSELDRLPDPIHNLTWLRSGWPGPPDATVYVRHEKEQDAFDLNFYVRGASYPQRSFEYVIEGPDGFRRNGESETPDTIEVSGAEGVYRVEAGGDIRDLYLPLARYDIQEVIEFKSSDAGTAVPAPQMGYWFYVPEGVEEFWIDFTAAPRPRQYVRRVSVWRPDGRRAWDRSYSLEDDPPTPPRVTITVPEGSDGGLWRASGGNFTIDPKIPPWFSLSGEKWFNPEP